jgi:hypothetical protein
MGKSNVTKQKTTRQQAVDRQLSQLPTVNREDLQQLWKELFGREPSPLLRRDVMVPILGYSIQEKAFGGLKESIARLLRELVEGNASEVKLATRPKVGTRYVREYNGKLHEVTVLDAGYEYEGSTYRSLTEIAKVITGAKWSGPAFFGQKRKAKEATV